MDEEDLDWGDTEIPQGGHLGPTDDADDGVSLGSESGDEGNNTAVPATTIAANASGAVSRVTQSNGASDSRSPKSSNFPPRESLPRESSSTSISSIKRNDQGSTASPKPKTRRSKSSSVSAPKVIHGLPPKPVVANVPLLPPSHPSLTEATKMSEAAKGKPTSNSSTNQPSQDADAPLPPDWQIRHPRSGGTTVYYYNTRTHQSTWQRPDPVPTSSSRTSNKAESVEPDTSRNALSYDDRHYRPGTGNASDNDAPPSHATRRGRTTDTWFGNAIEGRRDQSHSPPRGRNRSRSLSPPRRSRERGGRRRRSSRQRNANGDRDRESSLVQENDRHWHAPMEGGAASSTAPASLKSRKSQRSVQEPQDHLDESHPSHNTYPEREKSDSSHSRRSPPPRVHEPRRQEPQESHSSSTAVNSGKRDRPSRFAPPAAPASAVSSRKRDDDAWVPDEFKAPAMSPSADKHAHPEQRESREGRQTTADTRNMYSTRNDEPTSPSLPSGPTSEQSSSRRKRPPLPPQSARFRESKSNGRSSHSVPAVTAEASDAVHRSPQASNHVSLSPQSALPAPLPSVPRAHGERGTLVRDLPPHQRSSKSSTHDVPSNYDQPRDGRHERERERERGDRDRDRDRERPREPREEPRERGRERERDRDHERERERERRDRRRDDYADDTSPAGSSSRPPPRHRSPSRSRSPSPRRRSVSAEPSIRAGSGMYADNMAVDDPPPRAPRSMVPPSPAKNMYPSRPVRQSPPPASSSHRTEEGRDRDRDLPEPLARDAPRPRKDEALDSKIPGGPRARGRGRGGRGLPLSGTNNIPVGTRHASEQGPPKAPQNHYALPPPVPPSKLSGANTVPVKEVRTRGYNANHEPSDHAEPSSRSYSNSKDYPPSESEISRHAPNAREREDDGHRGSTRSRKRSLSIDEPRQRPHTEDEPRSSRRYRSPSPRARHFNGIDEPRSNARALASRDDQRGRSSDDGRPSNHRSARSPISPVSRRQEEDYPPRDRDRESRGRDGRTEPQRSPERRQPALSASSPPLKPLGLTSIPVPPLNAGLPMKPVPYNPPPPSPRPSGRVYTASEAEKRRKLEEEERDRDRDRERERERDREREREREGEREREREGERQRQRERDDEQMSRRPPDGRSQRPPIKLRRPPPPATPEPMDVDKTPAERPPLPAVSTSSGSGGSGLASDRDSDRDRDRHRDHRPSMSRQGASLLDRLGGVDGGQKLPDPPVSLRDRVTVPSKRDRDDVGVDDRYGGDVDDTPVGDESGSKRAKKKHGRSRRRGGRGPGGGPYP